MLLHAAGYGMRTYFTFTTLNTLAAHAHVTRLGRVSGNLPTVVNSWLLRCPAVMLALMATSWQPRIQEALDLQRGPGQLLDRARQAGVQVAAAAGGGAAVAPETDVGRLQMWRMRMAGSSPPSVHWPAPLQVPDNLEDLVDVPKCVNSFIYLFYLFY